MHTGQTYAEHGVFNLGDVNRMDADATWDIASRHDRKVWICGSMNASYKDGINGWVVPDPWSVNVEPNAAELEPYFDFVRSQVLEYTRTTPRYGMREALQFVKFMLRHGLRAKTILATLEQLFSERFQNVKWKRATILDRFQCDVFRYGYHRLKPDLATLFLNSTAHLQHCHWRNFEPEAFTIKPSDEDQAAYGGAVLFGYQSMDRIVGEVLDMAGDEAIVVLTTALSQQPCLTYEESGGKTFYKPDDFAALFSALDIDPARCSAEPVMSEEFHVRFETEAGAEDAQMKFNATTIEGKQAFRCRRDGESLLVGCAIFTQLPPDAVLDYQGSRLPFFELLYGVDTTKSGMHHPDGLFWMQIPGESGSMHDERLPLVDVAPTLLSLLELPVPASMKGTSRVPGRDIGEQRAVA